MYLPNDLKNIIYDYLYPYPRDVLLQIKNFGRYYQNMLLIYVADNDNYPGIQETCLYRLYFDAMKRHRHKQINTSCIQTILGMIVYYNLHREYPWINNVFHYTPRYYISTRRTNLYIRNFKDRDYKITLLKIKLCGEILSNKHLIINNDHNTNDVPK